MICNQVRVVLWLLKRVQVQKEAHCAARVARLGEPNHIQQRISRRRYQVLGLNQLWRSLPLLKV